jgi:voltage-gated potassium channel Kch
VQPVVYYISGHGFGHASRSIEVVNALRSAQPERPVHIRTAAPRWLFDLTVRGPFTFAPVDTDPGVVQLDSLRLDAAETVRRASAYARDLPSLAAEEAAALRRLDAAVVVADIPPLALEAARLAQVPSIAIGNFTWDWIFRDYPGGGAAADALGEVYRRAGRAFRLPLSGGFETVPEVTDVPFIARRATVAPADTRARLDLPAGRLALVSFGGYGVAGIDLDALSRTTGWTLLVSASVPFGPDHVPLAQMATRGALFPLDEPAMYAMGLRYEDVVAAVDVVVTKPGYGIISECLANDTALLYTDRGHFIEYGVLVRDMPRFVRCAYLPQPELLGGHWQDALDRLVASAPAPERPPVDGAAVAARRILEAARDGGRGSGA